LKSIRRIWRFSAAARCVPGLGRWHREITDKRSSCARRGQGEADGRGCDILRGMAGDYDIFPGTDSMAAKRKPSGSGSGRLSRFGRGAAEAPGLALGSLSFRRYVHDMSVTRISTSTVRWRMPRNTDPCGTRSACFAVDLGPYRRGIGCSIDPFPGGYGGRSPPRGVRGRFIRDGFGSESWGEVPGPRCG